jgi:hypothetical protein
MDVNGELDASVRVAQEGEFPLYFLAVWERDEDGTGEKLGFLVWLVADGYHNYDFSDLMSDL